MTEGMIWPGLQPIIMRFQEANLFAFQITRFIFAPTVEI